MLIANYPEDSTLRRHVDGHARFRLQAFMAAGPTDSTLRRHFEQIRASASPDVAIANERANTANGATAERTPEQPQATARKGGFFAWLSRLFGG